jgi:hypothetical protein
MPHRPLPCSLFGHFILIYSRIVSLCVAASFPLGLPILPASPSAAWAASAQIKTITPSCAAVGESVILNGNGFGSTNLRITVDGVPTSVTAATGNQATFAVPAGVAPGVVVVTTTNPGEQSGSIAFRVKGPEICGNNTVDEDCDGQIEDAEDCPSVNSPPVANAGPDQTQPLGTPVPLDGTASHDPDGDSLTFQWTLTSKPTESAATLSGDTTATPTFLLDKAGTYAVQLVVSDGTLTSGPASVIISTSNSAPVAQAGADQSGQMGTTLTPMSLTGLMVSDE